MVSLSKVLPKRFEARRRFEILGVFGSGKTTLARKLVGEWGIGLYESHEDNPFWGKPAELEVAGYLPYDLAFLVNHAFVCASHIAGNTSSYAVSDWSFITDRLWASMRLGKSLDEYDAVWAEVSSQAGPPLGYIYLDVAPEVIVDRMRTRGRVPEENLYPFIANAAEQLSYTVAALSPSAVLTLVGTTPLDQCLEAFTQWSNKLTIPAAR